MEVITVLGFIFVLLNFYIDKTVKIHFEFELKNAHKIIDNHEGTLLSLKQDLLNQKQVNQLILEHLQHLQHLEHKCR